MEPDTQIGGPNGRFPDTRHSAILAFRSSDPSVRGRAYEAVIASYWKPSYKYIRLRWRQSNEDAKDLTQEFFTRALEKNYLAAYDAEVAAFRTFLRTCLDRFVANELKSARRLKRGGEAALISLDFQSAERELELYAAAEHSSMEAFFYKEWVRAFFQVAINSLREDLEGRGKKAWFQVFSLYDLRSCEERPAYKEVAAELGISVAQVTNYLAAARREFRRILLARLREITASEQEFRNEAHFLFGTSWADVNGLAI
ncbi:MAG: RNA polymerase sigma factor [Bryobacteraceae bacterium]